MDHWTSKYRPRTYLWVTLIAGAVGAGAGGAITWSVNGYASGGVVVGLLPSIVTWLWLVHHMTPLRWSRTLLVGLASLPVGTVLSCGLPVGFVVVYWYLSVPLALGTASCMHLLLARLETQPAYPACLCCGYNLTGNVSGVCPECGTEIGARE